MGDLSGKKILVVEDEYFIAADLKEELASHGSIVIGPVGNLMSSLAILAQEVPHAAIVDVKLQGSKSYQVMEELGRQSVPYLLLTGYDEQSLPEHLRDLPRLTKPCSAKEVVTRLAELVAA